MTGPIIPDSALDTHIGVLGRTGSGKTYTARGLVERLLDARRQVVIVDPTGAWWGLRSHFPIPIFGGEHGDIAIAEDSGEAVARTIIEHSSSAIVDLSLLARQSGAAMRRFMRSFIARLKDKPNGAIWLVLDESDEFLPQMLPNGMESLFGDLKWIVRRGRVAGWRVMMITQRPQDIAKSVLTQIGTLVAHRLTAPQDRKAVEEWVKGHADTEQAKSVLSSLAGLTTGEAWVWWPDGDLLERGGMPAIRSFDSGATPDAGTGEIEQPDLTAIDMGAIRATLEGQGEAKKDLPATHISDESLKRRIADLETERDALRDACERKDRRIESLVAELSLSMDAMERITAAANSAMQALRSDNGIPANGGGQAEGRAVEDNPTPHSRSKGPLRPASHSR